MNPFLRQLTCAACVLLANAVGYAQQKPAAQLRGFSVVLVQGDQEGTSSELPAAARAAINDVKDFLPFKSYRLLDSSWTLTSNATQEYITRLRGDSQDYEVRISSKPEDPASIGVKFALQESGTANTWSTGVTYAGSAGRRNSFDSSQGSTVGAQRAPGEDLSKEEAQLSELRNRLQTLLQTRTANHPEVLQVQAQIAEKETRVAQLKQQTAGDDARWFTRYAHTPASSLLIDTSFSMRVGETVVVGTSRVRGNKALIALLTAVPASGKDKE
jgi:hypothetical protein